MSGTAVSIPTASSLELASEIVSAYISKNPVPSADLPNLLTSVHASIKALSSPTAEPTKTLEPAVSIRKSVQPDYLICLEDGKKFKSLKRHLRTTYGMEPDDYRRKWGLPSDYPMTAPNYSAQRSALARSLGLGKGNGRGGMAGAAAAPAAPEPAKASTAKQSKAATKGAEKAAKTEKPAKAKVSKPRAKGAAAEAHAH